MVVFVDNASHRYGRMIMCHLVSDDENDLHLFAEKIGCKREWFHKDHYDLPLFRRKRALQYGAIEISQREAVIIKKKMRRMS